MDILKHSVNQSIFYFWKYSLNVFITYLIEPSNLFLKSQLNYKRTTTDYTIIMLLHNRELVKHFDLYKNFLQ